MEDPCRYDGVLPCTGRGSREFTACSGCSGPVDMDDWRSNQRPNTTAAAPETVREEVKMPREPGKCPRCERENVSLYSTNAVQHKVCMKCVRALTVKEKPQKPASAPAKPAAAKVPPARQIAPQRAAPAASARFIPMTTRSLGDALENPDPVVLQVTCRSVDAVLTVVRAVDHDEDVLIGVGGR
jgi:hypothetical protein